MFFKKTDQTDFEENNYKSLNDFENNLECDEEEDEDQKEVEGEIK